VFYVFHVFYGVLCVSASSYLAAYSTSFGSSSAAVCLRFRLNSMPCALCKTWIDGEWLRWRLIEHEITFGWLLSVTLWRSAPDRALQTWYFICEACQEQKRKENPDWNYSNINADGNASTGSESDG